LTLLEEKYTARVAKEHPRRRQPPLRRLTAGEKILIFGERQIERRSMKRGKLEVLEAALAGGAPDRVHIDVVLYDAVGAHLELRHRRPRVTRARLGQADDAPGSQNAGKLPDHGVGIRDVMKRVEGQDPVDVAVGKRDPPSIEL